MLAVQLNGELLAWPSKISIKTSFILFVCFCLKKKKTASYLHVVHHTVFRILFLVSCEYIKTINYDFELQIHFIIHTSHAFE